MEYEELFSPHRSDVSVLYANEEHIGPGCYSGPTVRSIYIIECCTAGKGSIIINGKEFPFRAGDCYALLPGDAVKHTSDREDPRSGFWCVLDGFAVEKVLTQAGITASTPFFPRELFPPILQWLQMMTEHWCSKDAGAQLRQTACAYGLLGAILQNHPAPDASGIIDKAINYIQANYSENLSVDQIAQQTGLERTYFSSLFKQKTGLAPHRYLTLFRLRKACQLLDTGKYTVAEVSYSVGLEPHNFSRQFKQEVGMTAQKYLQMTKSGLIPTGFNAP